MYCDLSSGLRPGRSRGAIIIAFFLSLAASCSIKDPVAPTWEVIINLPLINKSYEMADLIDEEELATVGSDSIYFYDYKGIIDPIEVGDEITIEDLDETLSQVIGTFSVPSPPPQSVPFPLSLLYPPAAGGSGGIPVPIPAFSFSGIQLDMPAFGSFTYVVIDTGTVTLQVTNNMKMDFDTLGVHLLDEGAGNAVVMTVDVTAGVPLLAGETRIVRRSLAGVSTGNDLLLEAFGHTPGAVVILDGTEGIDILATIGEAQVSSATGEVGVIDFSFPGSLTITGGSTITSATLSAGTITLSLDNELPIPLDIQVDLNDLTDVWSNPVNINLAAPEYSSVSDMYDLADHVVTPTDDGMGNQILTMDVTVHSPGSQGSQVTLSSTDSVSVRTQLTDRVISSIEGILDSTTVDIPEGSFRLIEESGNLLDELRKVSLTAVDMEVIVRHTLGYPAHLELMLTGEGGNPDPVNLTVDLHLNPGSDVAPDTSITTRNESNSNVLDFLNAFPTDIRYSGSATVGDGSTAGSVSSTSFLEADIRLSTPLIIDVVQPLDIELDKEFQDEGIDIDEEKVRYLAADLDYSCSSTLGIEVVVCFMAAADSDMVYTNPDIEIVMRLQSPHDTARDTVITLRREQIEMLMDPFYTGVKIMIPPTGGTPLRVAMHDRLILKSFARVRAIINP